MKLIYLLILILTLTPNIKSQTKITGKFDGMGDYSDTIFLSLMSDYNSVFSASKMFYIDSAKVDKGGNFQFSLNSLPCSDCLYRIEVRPSGTQGALIIMGRSDENFALFQLQNNQTLNISGDARALSKTFSIDSPVNNWSFNEIRKLREPIYRISDTVYSKFRDPAFIEGKNLDSLRNTLMKEMVKVITKNNEKLLEFITKSDNIYSKIIGAKAYDYDMKMDNDIELYDLVINQLKSNYSKHKYYNQLKERIYDVKYFLPIGSKAPNLKLTNIDNNITPLSDIGKNLILIDFWASWCGPCRKETRETVKPLYEKYSNLGFEVYSVSMDDKKTNWLKAIEQDEMNWINVSDLMGKNSPVYKLYKFENLPTTYLIEKEGTKVLAKNLRGNELVEFLSNYYNK